MRSKENHNESLKSNNFSRKNNFNSEYNSDEFQKTFLREVIRSYKSTLDEILKSKRFRIGDFIVNLINKLLGRPSNFEQIELLLELNTNYEDFL